MSKYVFSGACTIETVPFNIHADDDRQNLKISGPCKRCNAPITIQVRATDYQKLEFGDYVQDCLPYKSASEREFLLSGICGKCWDEMFPALDDEEAEEQENQEV